MYDVAMNNTESNNNTYESVGENPSAYLCWKTAKSDEISVNIRDIVFSETM